MQAHENPFRSERVEALAFRPQGGDWETILRRLESLDYRCAIVGLKGSGKTTMLEELRGRLERGGRRTRLLRLNGEMKNSSGKRGLIQEWLEGCAGITMLLDGAEQLGWLEWRGVKRRARGGLIVTAHRAGMLPTLHRCKATADLLERLVGELDPGRADPKICGELFWRHEGNLRSALMECYLRRAESGTGG